MTLTIEEMDALRPETLESICTERAEATYKILSLQAENVQLKDMVRRLDWKLHAERR